MIVWVNKTLDRDPKHLFARGLLVSAYWKKGDFERQLTEDLRRGEARAPNEEVRVALRDIVAEILDVYRHAGLAEAKRCMLKHLPRIRELMPEDRSFEGADADLRFAVHYAEKGDLDQAFAHLERLLVARDPALIHLAVAPSWDSLRADPRFNQCLARMKLRPVGTVNGPMPESR